MSGSRMNAWHEAIGEKTELPYAAAVDEGKYAVLKTAGEKILFMQKRDPQYNILAAVCAGDLVRLFHKGNGVPAPFFAGLQMMDTLLKRLPGEERKNVFQSRSFLGQQISSAAWRLEDFIISRRFRGMDPLFTPHLSAVLQSSLFFYGVGKETGNKTLIKTALGSLRNGSPFFVLGDKEKLDRWGALLWSGLAAFDGSVPLPSPTRTYPNNVLKNKGRLGACFSDYVSRVTEKFPVPTREKILAYRLEINPSL